MQQITNGFHAHHVRSAPMMFAGYHESQLSPTEKRFANMELATPDQVGPVQHGNKHSNKGRRPRQRRFSESAPSIPLSRTPPAARFSPQHQIDGRQNDDRMNQLRPLFQIPSSERRMNSNEVRKVSSSPAKANVGEFNHRVSPTSRPYCGPKFTESPAASELPLPPMEWLPPAAAPTASASVKGMIFEQAAVQVANVRLRNLLTELQQSPKQIPVGIGA